MKFFSFQQGSEGPLLAFSSSGPRVCPKCGEAKMTTRRYCRGSDLASDQMTASWYAQGDQLVVGCDRPGEHIHVICGACKAHVLMESKQATEQRLAEEAAAVEALIRPS